MNVCVKLQYMCHKAMMGVWLVKAWLTCLCRMDDETTSLVSHSLHGIIGPLVAKDIAIQVGVNNIPMN